MSLDAAVLRGPQAAHDSFASALASDPAAGIVKHAVKIWARDHGVAEDDIARLAERVMEFARSAIHEQKVRAVA
jgi:anti-sigma regulatory factor (Ser/Thr protein kinase)